MDFLIVFKWLKDWGCHISTTPSGPDSGIQCNSSNMPPSIISTMMDIGLKVGSTVRMSLFRKKLERCGVRQAILHKIYFKWGFC